MTTATWRFPSRQFFIRVAVLEALDPLSRDTRIALQLIIAEVLK